MYRQSKSFPLAAQGGAITLVSHGAEFENVFYIRDIEELCSCGRALLLIKSFCFAVLIKSFMRLGYECDSETCSNDIPVYDSRWETPTKFHIVFNTNGFATVLFNFLQRIVLSKRALRLTCLVIPV